MNNPFPHWLFDSDSQSERLETEIHPPRPPKQIGDPEGWSNGIPECGGVVCSHFEGKGHTKNGIASAYQDPLSPNGLPITVDPGLTFHDILNRPFRLVDTLRESEAEDMYFRQLRGSRYLQGVQQRVPWWPQMHVNQLGALLSFVFNNGPGNLDNHDGAPTLAGAISSKDWQQIGKAILLYCRGNDRKRAWGLVRRRYVEYKLGETTKIWNPDELENQIITWKSSDEVKQIAHEMGCKGVPN
ncbi:MAG: hypothetical protein KTR18_03990 [Acidiferrobacterales bacterium]|nr:hypothetical protein [Acidiferrobacterales bacterium]